MPLMDGCRLVCAGGRCALFGQPPEVLKALLQARAGTLDLICLPDVRERHGSLLNNVEFLLYYFLFFEKGLAERRRLKLVGEADHIAQVLEVLRLTLLGPSEAELEGWGTPPELRREWLNAARFFALKDEAGAVRPVESFFEVVAFADGRAECGGWRIERLGVDRFAVTSAGERLEVDLNECERVEPPYPVVTDYVPAGFAKFAVEVLGGASGFSPEQPSTGLAMCANGHYVLIDAIPYVDHHLEARGISKNEIAAVFLTHLHDDHCNLFPLMRMAHRVDLITTREIYAMAMRKLAMGLGWSEAVVAEHFRFVEARVGERLRYYGLEIEPHHTVHSIPTVGAIFRVHDHGHDHEVCVVGDIQTFAEIAEMRRQGLVSAQTEDRLRALYERRFDLLVADGGMGPIHGDPADALGSKSERVVFVHVERLPERFNATFSLASSGKRYTILEGHSDIYATRAIEYLMNIFGARLTSHWLATLFADKEIKRYNTGDVILKQDAETWGSVYLLLAGHCEVIHHDGERFRSVGTREAGDLMGEMAVVTGRELRNASVIARTPVLACAFSERAFLSFLEAEGLRDELLAAWARRGRVGALPQFETLTTRVLDALCVIARELRLEPGETIDEQEGAEAWLVVCAGGAAAARSDRLLGPGGEAGRWRPFASPGATRLRATGRQPCTLLRFERTALEPLIAATPQLNYALRRLRAAEGEPPWSLRATGASPPLPAGLAAPPPGAQAAASP